MNPLVKKEIRLLLPAWIAAVLLAVVPSWMTGAACASDSSLSVWLPQSWLTLYIPLLAALGALYLGVASFGQEIGSGVFTLLLSQPAQRRQIWRIKTTMLSIAFLALWLAAGISVWYLFRFLNHLNLAAVSANARPALVSFDQDTLETLTLSVLIAFTGGLWTTLLLRQVTLAFWVALLTPMAIIAAIGLILDFTAVSDQFIDAAIPLALVSYAIFGFFYARKLFFDAQDVQWSGEEISFAWRRKSAGVPVTVTSSRPGHWLPALARKEIQLHQINLLIAVVLFFLQIACAITLKIHPHFHDPNVSYILEAAWVLWFVMPLLIGASAIAEERKLGIFDAQKCLPVSRGTQLTIKFAVALVLSVLLGGVLPAFFAVPGHFTYPMLMAAAVVLVLSFYASSLTRSTLQAIGVAALVAVAIALYAFVSIMAARTLFMPGSPDSDGLGYLEILVGGLVFLVVTAALTIWSANSLHETQKLWRRNLAAILIAFAGIFALTNAIYFRTWEFLTPLEPAAGPARLDASSNTEVVCAFGRLYATLPDGRLWDEQIVHLITQGHWTGLYISRFFSPKAGQFIDGSNWAAIAANWNQCLGIRSDCTLWSLQKKWNILNNSLRSQVGPFIIRQIGSDDDWTQVVGNQNSFWLLKRDGTLWAWGTSNPSWRGNSSGYFQRKLKLDLAMLPVRISNQTNWTKIFASDGALALKSDGSVWSSLNEGGLFKYPNGPWVAFVRDGDRYAGIKTNGELYALSFSDGRRALAGLGQNAKWKQVVLVFNAIVAIRSDGTLWRWRSWDLKGAKPVQLGTHSDWISLSKDWSATIALASDGSLWAWDNLSDHVLLAPSRKPVYLGNIFQGAENKSDDPVP